MFHAKGQQYLERAGVEMVDSFEVDVDIKMSVDGLGAGFAKFIGAKPIAVPADFKDMT